MTLDLDASHVLAQVWMAPNKELVEASSLIVALGDGFKAPQVQRTLKGFVFGRAEVSRHDAIGKLLSVVNLESFVPREPTHNVGIPGEFSLFEKAVKLPRELQVVQVLYLVLNSYL